LKYIKNNLSHGVDIEIVSDSKYVILGITEWIFNWQKNNWRNAAKKPVVNRELWESLFKLTQELKPKWTYVKGHNEDKYNDRADLIATSFAEGEPVELKK
jgi:ribonuclease HI